MGIALVEHLVAERFPEVEPVCLAEPLIAVDDVVFTRRCAVLARVVNSKNTRLAYVEFLDVGQRETAARLRVGAEPVLKTSRLSPTFSRGMRKMLAPGICSTLFSPTGAVSTGVKAVGGTSGASDVFSITGARAGGTLPWASGCVCG
jgi:hypothetical protein